MKNHLKYLLLMLVLALTLGVIAPVALAADAPAATSNVGDHNYINASRWTTPVYSYLVDNSEGTYTRVEYTGKAVAVETYDSDLKFVDGFTIEMELPIFGGFYSGEEYNFLVFGQENPSEDDTQEVIRVVSYTKDWERVGAASLFGANTTVPFRAGSLRFAEYNGYLYIRTSHEMYAGSDGVHHQSNLTMNVRIADMVITDSYYKVMNVDYGYVSHSFNQFIAVDGTDLVAVDHGDAHPRSVVLTRYNAPAGQDSFMKAEKEYITTTSYRYVYTKYVDALPIMGNSGANDTGVSVGGFEISNSYYLIAGNTVSQGDDYSASGQRNIFITATSKADFTDDGTTVHYLTSYVKGDGVTVSNPHFVKVEDNKYSILWTESGSENSVLRYAFVDGSGELISEIYTTDGYLSDCQPIVSDGKVIWYVTNGSAPAFYIIDLDDSSGMVHGHNYTYAKKVDPTFTSEGSLSSTCTICGEAGEDVILPPLNEEDYTIRMRSLANCTHGGTDYYYLNETMYGTFYYGVPTPRLPHDPFKVEAVAATCTTEGNIEYWDCITCANFYWKDETLSSRVNDVTTAINPDNHTALSNVTGRTEATCTENGYTGDTVCNDCGVTISGEVISALGHDLTHYAAVAATCVAEGTVEHWNCGRCERSFSDEAGTTQITDFTAAIDLDNHTGSTELVGKTDATCTENGYTGDTVCTDCGAVITEGTTLAMLEHQYNSIAKVPATCTTGGYSIFICDCGYSYTTDETEALGHIYEDGVCIWCGEAEPALLGDLDGDRKLSVADMLTLKNTILSGSITEEMQPIADVNEDGKVNVVDIMCLKLMISAG